MTTLEALMEIDQENMQEAQTKQTPKQQGLWDSVKYEYNKNVAQPVANAMGRKTTDSSMWFQPDEVVKDGVTYGTKGKNFNDVPLNKLESARDKLLRAKGDDTYYERTQDGRLKIGFTGAKGGAKERWKDDPNNSMWETTKEIKSSNAGDAEMLMHGNEFMLKQRAYDRGMSKEGSDVQYGATEIYKTDKNGAINGSEKPVKRSEIAEESFNMANFALTNEQIELQNSVVKQESIVTRDNFKTKSQDMNAEELIDYAKKNNTMGSKGAYSQNDLEFSKPYRDLANDKELQDFLGMDKKKGSKNNSKNLSKALGEYNVDITTLTNKATQLGMMGRRGKVIAKKLYDALEMYDATDLSSKQFGEGLINAAQDPTNLLGLGVVAKQAGKQSLKMSLKNIFSGTGARVGATEGAAYGAADSTLKQSVGVMGGQKEFSGSEVALGAGAGAVLGGSIGKIMDMALSSKTPEQQVEIQANAEARVEEVTKGMDDVTPEKMNELFNEALEEGLSEEVNQIRNKVEEQWQEDNPNETMNDEYFDSKIAEMEESGEVQDFFDIPKEMQPNQKNTEKPIVKEEAKKEQPKQEAQESIVKEQPKQEAQEPEVDNGYRDNIDDSYADDMVNMDEMYDDSDMFNDMLDDFNSESKKTEETPKEELPKDREYSQKERESISNRITNDFNKKQSVEIWKAIDQTIDKFGNEPRLERLKKFKSKEFRKDFKASSEKKKTTQFKEFADLYMDNPDIRKALKNDSSIQRILDKAIAENVAPSKQNKQSASEKTMTQNRQNIFRDINNKYYGTKISKGKGTDGHYNPDNNSILLGEDGAKSVEVHELTHAFTIKKIRKGLSKESLDTMSRAKKFLNEEKMKGYDAEAYSDFEYLNRISNGDYAGREIKGDEIDSAFNDEFLAIFTSNPSFRRDMYNKFGKENPEMWTRFKNEILKAFKRSKQIIEEMVGYDNLKSKISSNDEYQAMLKVLDEAMGGDEPKTKTTPKKVVKETPEASVTPEKVEKVEKVKKEYTTNRINPRELKDSIRLKRIEQDIKDIENNIRIKEEMIESISKSPKTKDIKKDTRNIEEQIKKDRNRIDTLNNKKERINELNKETSNIQKISELQKQLEPKPIKPSSNKRIKKDGNVLESEEIKNSSDIIERTTFQLSNPKIRRVGDSPIGDQILVPMKSREKGVEYQLGHNTRAYIKDGDKLSIQGGDSQKAIHKAVPHKLNLKDSKDVADELKRMLEIYDTNKQLSDSFGQMQPAYKNNDGKTFGSKKQNIVNRNQFILNQLYYMAKLKNTPKNIKRGIYEYIKTMKKEPELEYSPNKTEYKKAEESAYKKIDMPEATMKSMKDYIKEQDSRFNVKGANKKTSELDDRIVSTIEDKMVKLRTKAIKAFKEIEQKLMLKGEKWNGDITDKIKAKFPEESAIIDGYRHRDIDLQQRRDGQINDDMLKFREAGRIDDETMNNVNLSFEDFKSLDTKMDNIEESYRDIGMKNVDIDRKKSVKDKDALTPDDETVAKMEQKEREDSTSRFNQTLKNINEYKRTGKVPRHIKKGTVSTGRNKISKSQQELIDQNILTVEEIASLSSPANTTKYEMPEVKKHNKEKAILKVYEHNARSMGIDIDKKAFGDQHDIIFKDEIVDASNSAFQHMTALLGSKHMADYSKMSGGDVDVRTVIGEGGEGFSTSMSEILSNNSKFEADGTPPDSIDKQMKTWKDFVKPIFMTEQYGQGKDGSISDIMNTHGWSKEKATIFYNAYDEVIGEMFPEMKELRDKVYSAMDNGGSGKFEFKVGDETIHINLEGSNNNTVTIRGKDYKAKTKTGRIEEKSRALMPTIIHSLDAHTAMKMRELGYHTIHDAFVVPEGKTMDDVRKSYGEIIGDLNDSNILEQIGEEIGVDLSGIKIGDLKTQDIIDSQYKLSVEHPKGIAQQPQEREKDLGKFQSLEEVMKDFMASSNHRSAKSGQLIDSMVAEASFYDMSVAMKSDDPFERQFALAHQSSVYDKSKSVPIPKDQPNIDKKWWDYAQERIFQESRSKLEYNPLTRNEIKGDNKYFDKYGDIIGKVNDNIKEIIDKEIKIGKESLEKELYELIEQMKKDGLTYEDIQKQVNDLDKEKKLDAETQAKVIEREIAMQPELTKIENIVSKEEQARIDDLLWMDDLKNDKDLPEWLAPMIKESNTPLSSRQFDEINIPKMDTPEYKNDSMAEYKQYFARQSGKSKESKQFNRLKALGDHTENTSMAREEADLKYWQNEIPEKDQEQWTKSVLHTDYHAINGLTKELSEQFMKDFNGLYDIAKNYIDQASTAIGRPENQVGFFENNALGIVKKLNLPLETAHIIDKMISIKAMKDSDWKFVEKNMYSDTFREVMATRANDKNRSRQMFGNNPNSMVKGYIGEFYDGGKTIEDGKVIYDTSAGIEAGALPSKADKGVVGNKVSVEDMHKHSNKDLKSRNGEFYQVASAEIREELGRTNNFARIMSGTSGSIERKIAQTKLIDKVSKMDLSKIMSPTPKEGFVKLPLDRLAQLPHKIQGKSLFVHKGMYNQLLGKKKISVSENSSKTVKMMDKVARELAKRFARNVVLGNIPSIMNAIATNFTMGMMKGVSPSKTMKNSIESMDLSNSIVKLNDRISKLERVGRNADKLIEERSKNLLFKMQEAGLATGQVEGLKNNSSFFDTVAKDKTGGMGVIGDIMSNATLSSKSKMGKGVEKIFSTTDTAGRYSTAKENLDSGMTMEEAVLEANGLFGDTGQIAPDMVQFFNSYPVGAQFMTWATQTTPTILNVAKNNPTKAIAITMGLWALKSYSENITENNEVLKGGLRTDSYNPVISTIDFSAQPFLNIYDMISSPNDRAKGIRDGEENTRGKSADVGGLAGALVGVALGKGTVTENARRIIPYAIPAYIMKPSMNEINRRKKDKKLNLSREIKRNLLPSRGKLYESAGGNPIDTRTPSEKLLDKVI